MGLKKNLFQAFLVGAIVFVLFTIADRFGGFWAGVLGSIPIFLPIALFLSSSDTCDYTFMLLVSLFAYLVSTAIFVLLYHNNVLTRLQAMALAMTFWFVATVPLFLYFRKHPPAFLTSCTARYREPVP